MYLENLSTKKRPKFGKDRENHSRVVVFIWTLVMKVLKLKIWLLYILIRGKRWKASFLHTCRVRSVWDMTFGGGNQRGQKIPVAWQNQSQQSIAVTATISWLLICWTPLFCEGWTRPTIFHLCTPTKCHISAQPYSTYSAFINK
jgi:hypothetical protein